jgi:hypothetical protein
MDAIAVRSKKTARMIASAVPPESMTSSTVRVPKKVMTPNPRSTSTLARVATEKTDRMPATTMTTTV